MISLEHAMLVVDTGDAPAAAREREIEIAVGSPLANLFEARGIPSEGLANLEELAGTEERPLLVRAAASALRSHS